MKLSKLGLVVLALLFGAMVLGACAGSVQELEQAPIEVPQDTADAAAGAADETAGAAEETVVEEKAAVAEEAPVPPADTAAPTPAPLPSPTETEPPPLHQIYTIGDEIWDLAVADLNGDAHPDIAAADAGSGVLRLLLNNGDGTFAEAAPVATGELPYGVVAADLNGDTHVDLTVGHDASDDQVGKLSVLLNNGDGTFRLSEDYATGYDSGWINAADLDGDADVDLFIELATEPAPLSDEGRVGVGVWLNNGDGSFQDSQHYVIEGERVLNADAGDLNGDSFPDLAVRHYPEPKVSVLMNNGDGSFGEAVDYEVLWGPHWVTVAELNGDSYADIAVASTRGTVSVLLNNGDGSLQEKVDIETGGEPYYVDAVDMDGDTLLDLLVAPTGSGILGVFLNQGNGDFQLGESYYFPGVWAYVFEVADVDSDGNRDLVASGLGRSVFVFPLEGSE